MEDKKNKNFGVITEIGDLGLGFAPLNESDQRELNKQNEKAKNKDKKDVK